MRFSRSYPTGVAVLVLCCVNTATCSPVSTNMTNEEPLQISYVFDSFESDDEIADGVHGAALIGQGYARMYMPSSEKEARFEKRSDRGLHNCFGADQISIWYRIPANSSSFARSVSTTIQLELIVDSDPIPHVCDDYCTTSYSSLPYNVSDSASSDWIELSWSLLDLEDTWSPILSGPMETNATRANETVTGLQLHRIRGWAVRLDSENIYVMSQENVTDFEVWFDHLACFGNGSLFGAGFYWHEQNSIDNIRSSWSQYHHKSELAQQGTNIVVDESEMMHINYTVQQTEPWGGVSAFLLDVPGYYNLSSAEFINFDYVVRERDAPGGHLELRFIINELIGGCLECTTVENTERFYSFHHILGDIPNRPNVENVELIGSESPESPFWFTGWSGGLDDKILDKSRIKGFTLELGVQASIGDFGAAVRGAVDLGGLRAGRSASYDVEVDFEDSICIVEPGVTLNTFNTSFSPVDLVNNVRDCCGRCSAADDCLFGNDWKRTANLCLTVSSLTNSSFELSFNPEVAISDFFWMNSAAKLGDFCELCDCIEAERMIDCRGSGLLNVPRTFNQSWEPKTLDLRENPSLAMIGHNAFAAISKELAEVRFPAALRYLSPTALPRNSAISVVTFEDFSILNVENPIDGFFSSTCCAPEIRIPLVEPAAGLAFCKVQAVDSGYGAGALFLDFQSFEEAASILDVTPSSEFMGQAAESVELCAEYCQRDRECLYFQYDNRINQVEPKCRFIVGYKRIANNCCTPDHYADQEQTIPGFIAGVPPKTRKSFLGTTLEIISPKNILLNQENNFTASIQVRLGASPEKGSVWFHPEVLTATDKAVVFDPPKVSLHKMDQIAHFLVSVTSEQASNETLIVQTRVDACDQIFLPDASEFENLQFIIDVKVPKENQRSANSRIVIALLVAISFIFLVGSSATILRRKQADLGWLVRLNEVKFSDPPEVLGQGTFGLVLLAEWRGTDVAIKRVLPPSATRTNNMSGSGSGGTADLKFSSRHLNGGDLDVDYATACVSGHRSITHASRKLKNSFVREMRHLSKLRHPNIVQLMGAIVSESTPILIMEYMLHGSLHDILHNDSFPLDGDILLPILRDIASGMRFLHSAEPPIIHGDMKAANVLVDDRFRAKVSDFGLSGKATLGISGSPYWMAPELLRKKSTNSPETDVYSFGIVLYETFARKDPYDDSDMEFSLVLRNVADADISLRPTLPKECPPVIVSLFKECVVNDPDLRPPFHEIDKRFRRIDAESLDLGESRFSARQKKSMRSEDLLYKVFPKHVADALRDGRTVDPDKIDLACIFFSDIVGFTTLSSQLSPDKVTAMLDRVYLAMDEIADQYRVFKIDVIGDAYMCGTNLVEDQSSDHVKRMAQFSIAALKAASQTLVDEENPTLGYVNIRCGFHVGSVVGQVVGRVAPKYSVFGDTVNTASRMESSSLPGHIQCSARAAHLLSEQAPEINLSCRGMITVKGKGEVETFFVNVEGERPKPKTQPSLDSLLGLNAPAEQAPMRKTVAKVRSIRNLVLPFKRSNANESDSNNLSQHEFPICI